MIRHFDVDVNNSSEIIHELSEIAPERAAARGRSLKPCANRISDPETTRAGLELKAVIDQMREQVQNIE